MGPSQTERLWPSIPNDLKYVEVRIPGTFRELASNPKWSNEDIGRIVRCVALNTDFFSNCDVEAEVKYYLYYQKKKNYTRMKVEAHRMRKKMLNQTKKQKWEEETEIKALPPDPSENVEKVEVATPDPFPEPVKLPTRPKKKTNEDRFLERVRSDLQSFVSDKKKRISPIINARGYVNPLRSTDVSSVVQDVETSHECSSGPIQGVDTRDDAAWIPAKFAMFWFNYPRHGDRLKALKAFTSVIKQQPDVDKFMEDVCEAIDMIRKTNHGFQYDKLSYADEWLEAEGWKKDPKKLKKED